MDERRRFSKIPAPRAALESAFEDEETDDHMLLLSLHPLGLVCSSDKLPELHEDQFWCMSLCVWIKGGEGEKERRRERERRRAKGRHEHVERELETGGDKQYGDGLDSRSPSSPLVRPVCRHLIFIHTYRFLLLFCLRRVIPESESPMSVYLGR